MQILAADRPVDLIGERIDVALRVRVRIDTNAELTMRTLAHPPLVRAWIDHLAANFATAGLFSG